MLNKKLLWSAAALVPLVIAPVAVIASCSSTPVNQESHDQQASFALSAAKFYLESKAHLYTGFKPTEMEFDQKVNSVFTLGASRNFGFTTTVSGPKGESDKNDDTKGEKTVTISVTKTVPNGTDTSGKPQYKSVTKTEDVILKGLLTTEQATNEAQDPLKVSEIINLDPIQGGTSTTFVDAPSKPEDVLKQFKNRKATIYVKNSQDAANAPEFNDTNVNELIKALANPTDATNKEIIKKYLDPSVSSEVVKPSTKASDPGFGYKSLIKKDQAVKDVNFKWSNVRKTKNGNILSPTVSADLQLIDGEKTSGIIKVEIVGWKLSESYRNQVKPLIESMVQDFGTLYNPIVQDSAQLSQIYAEDAFTDADYWKDAGESKSIMLPDWQQVGNDHIMPLAMEATLVGAKPIAFDADRGSVTLKLELKRKDAPENGAEKDTIFTKELTIYGFKVGAKPAPTTPPASTKTY